MKTVLISGGARGIGYGIAESLLQCGYRVVVTGLTDDEVTAVYRRDNLSAMRLDVTDDQAVADRDKLKKLMDDTNAFMAKVCKKGA